MQSYIFEGFLVPQVQEFTYWLTNDTIHREHSMVRMRCSIRREPQSQQYRIEGRRCIFHLQAKDQAGPKIRGTQDSPSVTG